jgi:hypothetical protein
VEVHQFTIIDTTEQIKLSKYPGQPRKNEFDTIYSLVANKNAGSMNGGVSMWVWAGEKYSRFVS